MVDTRGHQSTAHRGDQPSSDPNRLSSEPAKIPVPEGAGLDKLRHCESACRLTPNLSAPRGPLQKGVKIQRRFTA